MIILSGGVYTALNETEFMDKFIDWLEENNMSFVGFSQEESINDGQVAILNLYDDLSKDIQVKTGDYVVANTDDFNLEIGKAYKILQVNSIDLITIDLGEGLKEMYSIEYFNEYKKDDFTYTGDCM